MPSPPSFSTELVNDNDINDDIIEKEIKKLALEAFKLICKEKGLIDIEEI